MGNETTSSFLENSIETHLTLLKSISTDQLVRQTAMKEIGNWQMGYKQ